MNKPAIRIDGGCEYSAFMLLMRAKRLLREAGFNKEEIRLFGISAGQDEVLKHHTKLAPRYVYQRVMMAVEANFFVRE